MNRAKASENYYNIHDIVTFGIVDKSNFLNGVFYDFDRRYENFKSPPLNKTDFTVYLGDFIPSNQDCYILEDNYYIKEDYFYCAGDSYKWGRWKFELLGLDKGDCTIHIYNNPPAAMVISGILIDFLIHYVLSEKGYPLIHASCLSLDNRAYVFASRGGGKTVIALELVEKGFTFLGDNFTIVHNGQALSFLSPLNIFTYNLAPVVKRNLAGKDKLLLSLKQLVYSVTLGYVKIFTQVNIKQVLPQRLGDRSKVDSVFLLIPKEKFSVEKIDKEELLDHLVINQKLDFYPFTKYILEYSYMFPESHLAAHWDKYKENLRKNLSGDISYYRVETPQSYTKQVFDEIFSVIKK